MKQDRRGSWYLLTGIVLGIGFGLVYSWVISPVKYVDAPPYSLREDYKEQYRVLVALAYLYSGDLVRAQDRLAQLKDDETAQTIAMQAQRALADGQPEKEVRALSQLAAALNKGVTPAPINPTILPTRADSTQRFSIDTPDSLSPTSTQHINPSPSVTSESPGVTPTPPQP